MRGARGSRGSRTAGGGKRGARASMERGTRARSFSGRPKRQAPPTKPPSFRPRAMFALTMPAWEELGVKRRGQPSVRAGLGGRRARRKLARERARTAALTHREQRHCSHRALPKHRPPRSPPDCAPSFSPRVFSSSQGVEAVWECKSVPWSVGKRERANAAASPAAPGRCESEGEQGESGRQEEALHIVSNAYSMVPLPSPPAPPASLEG